MIALNFLHSFTGGYQDGGRCVFGAPVTHGSKVLWAAGGGAAAPNYGAVCGYDTGTSTFYLNHAWVNDPTQGEAPTGNIGLNASVAALYATCANGGANGNGALSQLDLSLENNIGAVGPGNSPKLLYSFSGSTDGAMPNGCLYDHNTGNIYGTCSGGGASGDGTLWAFNVAGGTFTVLHTFTGSDGAGPQGVIIRAGVLWGLCEGGSAWGTVWQYVIGSSTFNNMVDFTSSLRQPRGCLTDDGAGYLWGVSQLGGTGYGAVFKYDIATNVASSVYAFTGGTGGQQPIGGVCIANDGNMYGTCSQGGTGSEFNGNGIIWELAGPGFTTFTQLYDFGSAAPGNGATPNQQLVQAADGNLYGSNTFLGGGGTDGVAFSFTLP